LQCHAWARESLGAWFICLLPIDTGLATLSYISIALPERGFLCQGTYSHLWVGTLIVGEVVLRLRRMAKLTKQLLHILSRAVSAA
jgi:hypothetical protein